MRLAYLRQARAEKPVRPVRALHLKKRSLVFAVELRVAECSPVKHNTFEQASAISGFQKQSAVVI